MRVLVASAVALWCQAGQHGLINGFKTQNPPPACLHKALGSAAVCKGRQVARPHGPRAEEPATYTACCASTQAPLSMSVT